MLIDITLKITPKMLVDAQGNEKMSLIGHIGTHFDVMNKEFPINYTKRKGIVFDVSNIAGRDIGLNDINLDFIDKDMFVAFYTGFIEKEQYGTKTYFTNHPQLSDELIDCLLEKSVSIIGVDFAGIRRGKEHTPKDQYCADRGAFVIENLWNLQNLCNKENIIFNTFPMNYADITGLPCRVIAEV